MKSWEICVHAVRQVTGNLGPALQITALLSLGQIALSLALGLDALRAPVPGAAPSGADVLALFVWLVVSLFTGFWMSVAWHRFVLTGEVPAGFLPPLQLDRIGSYFLNTMLIGLVAVPMVLAAGLVIALLFGSGGAANLQMVGIVLLLLYIPIGAVLTRLSVILPAAALDRKLTLGDAWLATRDASGTVAGVVALLLIGSLALDLPPAYLFPPGSLIGEIWLGATYWLKVVIGLSVLTTLYGHYIEKRPLITQG